MGIRYIGNCEWAARGSIEWTVGGYGEDRGNLRYSGRMDKEKAFHDTLTKWKAAASPFGTVFLDGWSSSSAKPYLPEVNTSYVGFRNGQIPPVKVVNGTSSQQAQGSGEDTAPSSPYSGQTISGTLFYHASRSNYEWWETSLPAETPRYLTVQNAQDPFLRVYAYSVTAQEAGSEVRVRVNSIPFDVLAAAFRSLVRIVQWSDYNREPVVEGKLWHCSCSVDYVLQ